ncbi:MAG: hypothetical protein HY247_01225 [archaeon]|nr:MAG: hypothetical protein HY247_01225 [archaeon]
MKRVKERIFPYHFAPDEKLFHIVVQIKDLPGALGSVLSLLSDRLDLVGITSYGLDDSTAICSAFARAMSRATTADHIHKSLKSSPMVVESFVEEGRDGLLVDGFHTGMETKPGQEFMLMPRRTQSAMMRRIVKEFGSGGKAILYEEGVAAGEANAEFLVELLGEEGVSRTGPALLRRRAVYGWGEMEPVSMVIGESATLRVIDCFECSEWHRELDGCHFWRGFIVGRFSSLWGTKVTAEEVKCVGRGDDFCDFSLKKVQG